MDFILNFVHNFFFSRYQMYFYPVRKAQLASLDIKYLTGEETRGKLKILIFFSHGVNPIRKFSNAMNAPCESLLTGFIPRKY